MKEIEEVVKVEEESEDMVDLVLENTLDKLVDGSGLTRKLFNRDAAQTRKAMKRSLTKLRPPFLPFLP
ncbi:MAG: hypothetical protein ACE5JL_12500 [Dehalococcoidia bacterium]